eukprot:TRINITY_DN7990_c0_g1_i1.p1 TRINITY_DN7990_c0_g1~~TRINITY_DN7990_c0_g1_i1.p1  ORF type:complete len:320 (+),score=64.97 TRINITY_DN7990_c0_g1_i1:65-1024(+)
MPKICPICECRIPARSWATHEQRCEGPPEDTSSEFSNSVTMSEASTIDDASHKTEYVDENGVTWASGMRVASACPLADRKKKEYAAGSTGTVWQVLDNGLLAVNFDQERVDGQRLKVCLVNAEPCDLVQEPHYLPAKTPVLCLSATLRNGKDSRVIPSGTAGEVREYRDKTKAYLLHLRDLELIAEVPARLVMPVKKTGLMGKVMKRVRALSGAPSSMPRMSPHSQASSGSPSRSPASSQASPKSPSSPAPLFSNLSGSPKSRRSTFKGGSPTPVLQFNLQSPRLPVEEPAGPDCKLDGASSPSSPATTQTGPPSPVCF